MFATIAEVLAITEVTVTDQDIYKAQALVETAAGRPEELIPLTATTDLLWLKKATAYQCAYMKDDPLGVYEQPNVESVTQDGGFKIVNGERNVWLAPASEQALRNLSWRKSRNVKSEPFDYRAERWRQERQMEWDRAWSRRWVW
ncbi:head-to-tail adaptor [Streptomyces phage Mulchroom]|nr:head-to-tail adaptor [Streptomyces phage Mulchroom]